MHLGRNIRKSKQDKRVHRDQAQQWHLSKIYKGGIYLAFGSQASLRLFRHQRVLLSANRGVYR